MPGDLEAQRWIIQLAASGHIRTRADAETMVQEIEGKGWTGDLRTIYRAVLALLGDRRTLETLPITERVIAKTVYNGMLKRYLGAGRCECSPAATTGNPGCPVHGRTPDPRLTRLDA